ncbi:hypothetical protein T260_18300 [Geobacillus thermopakistaniensis]|uniref:Uncharacterized protein n=1 Tax=Geobacillus thermopakistaniensis (strain MAS1) TaxID=1408282 RepID=A0A7U9J7W8_GEOTM|nr:hypothetical protein T260_18300 [Geobacillus sp. MAS1]KAF0994396.1 hypothetical protein BJQ97_01038 [Geobacillus sp. TFV-3]
MFRFFCEQCGFEIWSIEVIPKLKCHCGIYSQCEEKECGIDE